MGNTIAILAGILVVIAGIALLGVQMMENNGKDIQQHNFTLISAEAGSSKLQVGTGFLGVPLIALGIFLLVVGAIVSRGS